MPYLITGATGSVGRSIVDQLRSAGADVRVVTRDAGKAPAGVDTVRGDFTKGDLPASAFAGVRRMFLFPAQGGVDLFLAQAKRAGVEQIVVLSSLAAALEHARDKTSPSAAHHLAIENAVRATGIPATVLRPGTFANNLLFWASAIQAGTTVYGPYGQSAQAPIHEADVAAVAVAALLDDGHAGKVYPMTGPQALTRVQQLATISDAVGRKLRFQEVPPEVFRNEMAKYMPAPIIKMLLDYWSDTVTTPDTVLATVAEVTGRPARPLASWAKDHAAAFAGGSRTSDVSEDSRHAAAKR
jgi:uncharacterized protein YbjT (DUF2867 family)